MCEEYRAGISGLQPMQIVVHRLDQTRYRSIIDRDDGVRYLLDGVGAKGHLPHDLSTTSSNRNWGCRPGSGGASPMAPFSEA
jgi:hypothetical protein